MKTYAISEKQIGSIMFSAGWNLSSWYLPFSIILNGNADYFGLHVGPFWVGFEAGYPA